MRWWGFLALLLLAGLAVWSLADSNEVRAPEKTREREDAATGKPPVLVGAPRGARDAHARREAEAEAAEERLLARRGEGGGGFLAGILTEGCFGITGRLLGADGAAVPESVVTLLGDENEYHQEYTDDDGRFLIEYDARFPMRMVLGVPGHLSSVGPWRRYRAGEHVDIGTVRLARGHVLAGTVVDQHGDALSRAFVEIYPDDDPLPGWWKPTVEVQGTFWPTLPALGGRFRFEGLRPGRYRLAVRSIQPEGSTLLEGVASDQADLRVEVPIVYADADEEHADAPEQPAWTARLELHPGDRRHASWHDPRDGTERRSWDGLQAMSFGDTRRSHAGTRLDQDAVILRARGPGPLHVVLDDLLGDHAPTYVRDLARADPVRRVRLADGVTLRGRITGLPPAALGDAWISVASQMLADGTCAVEPRPEDQGVSDYSRQGAVDREGRFTVHGLLPGTVRLRLQGTLAALKNEGRVVPYVDVPVGKGPVRLGGYAYPTVEVTCTVPESHALETLAWVLEDRSPLGGYERAGGEVEMLGLRAVWRVVLTEHAATHALWIRCSGEPPLGPVEVLIPPGAKNVHVPLTAGKTIQGRVVDVVGKPVPRAWVELRGGSDTRAFEALPEDPYYDMGPRDGVRFATRLDGTFSLSVPPSGTWYVFAHQPGMAMRDPPAVARPGPLTVTMVPGYRITGRVVLPEKHAEEKHLWNCMVHAWPEDGGRPHGVRVGDDGFFEVTGLRAGSYTLAVHPIEEHLEGHPREAVWFGQAVVRGVEAGARGVSIELRGGDWAELDLVDGEGTPLVGVHVMLRGPYREQRLWAMSAKGPFGTYSLGPGSYRFAFEIDGKGRHEVEAKRGETVRYVVR